MPEQIVVDKIKLVKAFLSATENVLTMMCFLECETGRPEVRPKDSKMGDVIGVVGMTGDQISASLALVFPKNALLKIVSNMLGEEFTELDDDIVDAVGELTNMICGGAKKELAEMGYTFEMAIPSMIRGTCQINYHKTAKPIVQTPICIGEETFWVEVAFME